MNDIDSKLSSLSGNLTGASAADIEVLADAGYLRVLGGRPELTNAGHRRLAELNSDRPIRAVASSSLRS
jgi:hypothetical protein